MNDEQFLQALETCQLPASQFGHSAHVRAAYLYLQSHEFVAALEHLRRAIRNFAASLGQAGRYHETITVAYLALIQQHICECGNGGGWQGFAQDNPELLERGLLLRFYPRAQLESELARRVFVLPHPTRTGAEAERGVGGQQ